MCDLGIGDALHAAHYRVEENDRHTDHDTDVDVHFKEARKHHADTAHLSRHISEGNKNGTEHGDHTRGSGVVTISDKIRHGKFTEFT
ncbi:Uncharacterised protein [Vibrio cholerae]|uniref:Uncharacterized protein n=1 Tax=Vibrio cholerae TaxID=666 RepID=A0A655U158_VIBCL|nr:Uncharacterised protein [Vibrio cholerae]CSA85250.1 Uncharacterised protein [Vibrio cholerae]CSB43074.1 Uncharacterised protein [Vibrio cholerae]CSB78325.1 Uncharacterised protein [Vibrio cholerae]CSB94751.1 Uncharacterised protein [Vibrio cholerae]